MVNIGLGNGLATDDTNPSKAPVLTYGHSGLVAFLPHMGNFTWNT